MTSRTDGPVRWALVTSGHMRTHRVDLDRCRRGWMELQRRAGGLDQHGQLADRAGVGRRTLYRFWAGGPTSIAAARAIVAVLGLEFSEVAEVLDPVSSGST